MESTRVKYGTTERVFAMASDSSGNSVTGLTDVKLEIYRKSDGKYFDFNDSTFKSSGWTTRQGVMTELSASLSPGVYYYDFDTTSHTSQYVEETFLMTMTSTTAVNDPTYGELKVGGYVDQIGISSGVIQYGKGKGMTVAQIEEFAKKVWQVVLEGGKTAAEVLLTRSEFNALTDKVLVDFPEIKIPEMADRTDEVLFALSNMEKPKDYSKEINAVGKKLEGLASEVKPVVADFAKTVSGFQSKMNMAEEKINSYISKITNLKSGFDELKVMMEKYGETISSQTDMDRRMAQLMNKFQEKDLELVNEKLKRMMTMITEAKYDILKELK